MKPELTSEKKTGVVSFLLRPREISIVRFQLPNYLVNGSVIDVCQRSIGWSLWGREWTVSLRFLTSLRTRIAITDSASELFGKLEDFITVIKLNKLKLIAFKFKNNKIKIFTQHSYCYSSFKIKWVKKTNNPLKTLISQ